MRRDGRPSPDPIDPAAAVFFEALAHPVRLRIVCGLLEGECCVVPMAECLGLPQAFVSRHLAILRRAGVVTSVVEGRQRIYRVAHPAVRPLVALLRVYFPAAEGGRMPAPVAPPPSPGRA